MLGKSKECEILFPYNVKSDNSVALSSPFTSTRLGLWSKSKDAKFFRFDISKCVKF